MSFKNPQTERARSKFARVLPNKGADFRLVEYRVNFLMESADYSMQLFIFPLRSSCPSWSKWNSVFPCGKRRGKDK